MLTFKFFKRLLALIVVLLVAVSADAQMQTFTVTNTKTSGAGSFQDAINTVNEKGGSWTIKFDLPSGSQIKLEHGQSFKGLDELKIDGEGKVKILFKKLEDGSGVYPLSISGQTVVSINGIDFDYEETENKLFCHIDFTRSSSNNKLMHVKNISNCSFNKVGVLFDGCVVDNIEDCNFVDCDNCAIVFGKAFNDESNDDIRIKKIQSSYFENCSSSIYARNGICDEVTGCVFYGNKNVSEKTLVKSSSISGTTDGLYNLIANCTFVGNENNKPVGAIQSTNCKEIANCSFKNYNSTLKDISVEKIHNCDFIRCFLRNVTCAKLYDCTMKDNTTCCIQDDCHITEVDDCEFIGTSPILNYTKSVSNSYFQTFGLQGKLANCVVSQNTFEDIYNIGIDNTDKTPGLYTKNVFIKNSNEYLENAIYNASSSYKKPIISIIGVQGGKIRIEGETDGDALVEIFQNDGKEQTAIRYLTSVESDGSFIADIDASIFAGKQICVTATATYKEKYTSELSDKACYELPLEFYVKKTSKGSGKNWKDAISENDFYGILPIAKDGTTFHIAEGVYEIDNQVPNTYTYLSVNSSIKIIGGYPETNEEDVTKVKSNPTLYSTNFKTVSSGNAPYFIFHKTGVEVEFHNVDFTDTWLTPGSSQILKNLVIDSCRFSNTALSSVHSDNLEIRNSLFSGEKGGISFQKDKGTATVENCTFITSSSLLTMEQLSDVRISNCTFYSNTVSELIHICADKTEFFNNTIIGNSEEALFFSSQTNSNTAFTGNILYGTCSGYKIFAAYKNNITSVETSGSNTYVSDYTTILEGKNVDGKFVPTLAYNGGFTPTVKLISDKLADGSSFRFPLEETSVTVDQRGETRLTSTCPGAYEIPFIVPDLKEIYVKQSGKGSGANWKDAMSPKDFVNVLPFANEGTTFYVAAGTYDFNKLSEGKYVYENENYFYTYENYPVKNGVIIRGGYPENPTFEVPSDPATNKTIFTSLYKASSRDASVLQFLGSSELHNLYFDDLLLEVNKADGEMTPTLLIDSCVISATEANFTYDYKNINHINVQKGGLDVRNTTFNGYCGYLINASECSAVYIQNSTFAPIKVSGSTSIMLGTTKTSVVWIVNNTFYKAESASLIQCGSSCPLQFYNNTVVSKYGYRLIGSLDAVGNLFYSISDAKGSYMYAQKPQSNMYNVVVGTDGYDGDMMVAAADLATILSGSVVGGSFEPELANNGGYTQTVKLVGTKLPDGTSIKFPRSASGIYVDQRDVSRMESTCAGAYELSVAGLNEVYVKKDGQGNGTSWDDAMSEADFFAALPLAKEGTTFYVAAGEYVKTESSPVWLRNGIKVIGGYPAKAKKGAVCDPVNNHTVLKASSDKASMTISYMYNFDCGSGKQTAEFHNLDFFGTRLDLNVDNIVIDSCNFYECYNPVNVNCAQNLRISNSYFALNKVKSDKFDYSININCDPVAVIENCTFDEKPYTTAIKVDSELDTASVRVVNNTFLLRDRANTEWADEEGEHYYFYLGSKKRSLLQNNTVIIVDALGQMNVSKSINTIGTKNGDFYYNLYNVYDDKLFSFLGGGGHSYYADFGGTINTLNNGVIYNVSSEVEKIIETKKDGDAYIPVLAYNGGYTPTIKLVKDKLSDGVSIRNSLISTHKLDKDQRGVTRANKTCVGAYEFECSKGEFAVNKSTIKVSNPYCNLSPNGGVDLKIGNWVDGCKAYFFHGKDTLWSVDALDSPNNKYKLRIADNAIEDLFNGAKYVDSVIFSYFGLPGGSYSFVLEDLCGNKTTTPITIDPIEKPAFVVSKSSKTELSCYNSTDGSIEITLVGGELELCGKVSSYDIKGLEFTEKNRTVKATGLTPGSYRFVYGTTAKMCGDNADTTIVITAPDTVKAKCDFKDAYCAEIGGSATFTAEGGVGNYSVTIRDINGNVFKKESFAGKNTVSVGGMKLMTTYSAVVEDGNGCKSKELGGIRFWTKPIPQLNTSLTPSNETCYEENNGRIRLTYSGNKDKDVLVVSAIGSDGKPHNTYFSEDKGSVFIEELAPDEYTVKLDFGAEGCNIPGDNATTIGTVTIKPFERILVDASSLVMTSPTCTNPANGRADIEIKNWPKGGMVTVYSNGNGMWGTQGEPTVGEYIGAAPGQFYYENEEKKKAHTAHVKIPNINGKTYTVEVKDKCGNVNDTYDFDFGELSKPMVLFREDNSHIELDCAGSTDGVIFFNVGGGSTPNLKAFVNDDEVMVGKGNCVKEGLPAGSYVIAYKSTVEGCKDAATETIEITEPTHIEIHKLSPAPVVCVAEGTTAYASVGGGTPDYTYRWTDAEGNVLGTGDKVEHLSVGNDYKLLVTDSKLCKDSATFNVGAYQMDPLTDISVTKFGSKDQTCFGVDNGEIRVYYSGNTSETPLKLLVIGAEGVAHKAVSASENGNIVVTDLAPGVYSVFLDHDNEWCEQETPAAIALGEKTISPVGELAIDKKSLVINVATCSKPMNGSAEIDVLNWVDGGKITVYRNGSPQWGTVQCEKKPYTSPAPGWFYYENAEKMAEHTAHLVIPRIDGGDFKVEVIDNCEDTVKFEFIHEKMVGPAFAYADDQVLDLKCSTDSYGKIAFHTTGGSIFSYYVDGEEMTTDGADKYVKDNLPAGTYTISSKSKLEGCKDGFKEEVVITAPPALVASPKAEPVYCDEVGATAKANVVGGTPEFTYSWTDAEGNEVGKKAEVSHLKADVAYTLVVTDANMCQTNSTVSPKYAAPLTSISVNKVEEKHQKCYGVDNGEITVSFSGNTSNASLKLVAVGVDGKPKKDVTTNLEEGSVVISDLAPGTYDVRLGYNVSGCETSDKAISVAKDLVILALDKPVFLKDKKRVEDNPCENIGKGRMHLEMVGWTPNVYKWTLKRAGQTDAELEIEYHCGDKLPNGATAFDLMTLPEGENVFTMWDACGIIHMDTAIIGHRDLAPITIDTVNSKAISCEGRTDGGLTFVAWPWDVEDKALITLEDDTINVTPVITDGKAYFELNGHGAGTYTLTTTDLCGDKKPKDIDFTAFSAQNGMLTVDVDFDAEAAKCDVEKRVFKVTANGGTAPYVYSITKGNATVQTTEATEKKSFNSQLLTDGTYVVTVTDKTDCKAVYDEGLTIKPSHTMKADMHEVACGDGKSVTISTLVDGGKTSATHYVAVDETGKKFQPSSFEDGIVLFENVPVNVTLKGLVAEVDGCNVYAELGKLPLDATALAEAKVTVDKVINERCYGATDGGLKLSYNGPKSSYDVAMRLVGVNGTTATINTPNKRGTNLSFEFEKLAPGEYELYLVQKVGQCDAGTEPKKIQKVKIEEMPHKFELLWDTVIQSICFKEMNATASLKVRGWSEGNCTWTLDKVKNDYYTDIDKLLYPVSNTDAYPVSGDTAYWGSAKLSAGRYTVTWTACNTSVSKEFEIKPLKEPSLKVLASSNTDLKCNYDKAYVDFHYEGGSPVNKRILIKYLPVGNSNDDWDFTTEKLKAENTYRLYGFTPGPGNMGHKKAEGITYKLTDEDKGLPDGKYTILYEDTTGACEKDNLSAVVTVRRNNPINIQAYKRDVVCNEKAQGTLAFTFGRPGYTWPSYTDDSYYDKYTGINWASLIFMSDKNQEKMYRREVNQSFIVYTNEQLELIKKTYEKYGFPKQTVKYIIDQYKQSIPFRSNMFSDVKKVELIARGVSQEKLYSRLAQTLDTLMKYPLEEMYKNGLNYKVPTDWMGFNTLYADYYNVVVTDTFGCRYVSDTIQISMPNYQKPLTIDNMVYDDKEGFCDADKRRITFRVSGGWGDYHYSAVNLDSADVEKSLADLPDNPDDGVSYGKLLDKNYVADARIETHGKKGTPDYYEIYTTPIQKPGRIRVSVVDSLGCKTNGQDITLTAKYLMSGLTQNDWCSPDEKNNFYPVLLNGDKSPTAAQVDSFKVRIGHRTVRDDSVEYRKVLPSELVLNTRTTDGTQYYGKKYIEKVPGGQIGFFAYMEDGCSAFGEYDFGMRDDFRELKLTAEGTIPSYCYNDSTGALLFSIYGGNEYYKKLYLDDVDLMSNSDKELISKHVVRTEHVVENNVDKVKVDTTDYDLTFNGFTSKELFADLNKVYGNQFKKEPDPVQYSYYFTLQNLGGNTHLVNPLREDTFHTLVVEDTKGCRDTLAFKVDQPEMLYIRAAGSVMCADGSGRIYVDSVAGGVGGYRYSLDKTNIFDENTHKKVMFDGVTKHTLSVTDDHGCFSLPSSPISTGESISWDDVEQDVMISTWHDYGDALVVIDKTNYHRLKYNTKGSPYYGKPYDYHYDSIKVEIIRGDGFPEQIVGKIQPKEFYIYGIPSQKFANVENGDTDVDTTGMHIDGSVSVYIPWLGKHVQGPSWGVPAEVVATVKTDEQLKFMDVQYGLEVAALNDTVNMKIDKICGCGYLNNLSKLSVLLQKEYPTQSDKNNIQYLETVINSIKTTKVNNTDKTIEETAKKQVGYSDKVDALKKKYGFGYGTLSQIREVFTKLVPDSAAERMTFIKFEEIRGTNSDGTPAPSVLDKYFNTETESEVLPFAIRTTTYISGCDITEEYNPLILNLKGDNPYPDPDFRNSIKLECVPSILSNNQSQTELIVRLSRPENFSYQVFGLDGRLIKAKTANTVVPVTQTSADGKEESVYTITLTGISQSSVVKVCTDSDCAATKVLVR